LESQARGNTDSLRRDNDGLKILVERQSAELQASAAAVHAARVDARRARSEVSDSDRPPQSEPFPPAHRPLSLPMGSLHAPSRVASAMHAALHMRHVPVGQLHNAWESTRLVVAQLLASSARLYSALAARVQTMSVLMASSAGSSHEQLSVTSSRITAVVENELLPGLQSAIPTQFSAVCDILAGQEPVTWLGCAHLMVLDRLCASSKSLVVGTNVFASHMALVLSAESRQPWTTPTLVERNSLLALAWRRIAALLVSLVEDMCLVVRQAAQPSRGRARADVPLWTRAVNTLSHLAEAFRSVFAHWSGKSAQENVVLAADSNVPRANAAVSDALTALSANFFAVVRHIQERTEVLCDPVLRIAHGAEVPLDGGESLVSVRASGRLRGHMLEQQAQWNRHLEQWLGRHATQQGSGEERRIDSANAAPQEEADTVSTSRLTAALQVARDEFARETAALRGEVAFLQAENQRLAATLSELQSTSSLAVASAEAEVEIPDSSHVRPATAEVMLETPADATAVSIVWCRRGERFALSGPALMAAMKAVRAETAQRAEDERRVAQLVRELKTTDAKCVAYFRDCQALEERCRHLETAARRAEEGVAKCRQQASRVEEELASAHRNYQAQIHILTESLAVASSPTGSGSPLRGPAPAGGPESGPAVRRVSSSLRHSGGSGTPS
jgi:septal ring factor EnvC (AmiA/AmiB activator)